MSVDKSIDVTILFIHSGEKCFFHGVSGVIVLPIGDSICLATYVAVILLNLE